MNRHKMVNEISLYIFTELSKDHSSEQWKDNLLSLRNHSEGNYHHHAKLTWILAGILFPLSLGLFAKGLELFYHIEWWQFTLIGLAAIVMLLTWALMFIRWGLGIGISLAIMYGCEKLIGHTYIGTRIFYDMDLRNRWFDSRLDIRSAWFIMIAGAIGLWLPLVIWKFILQDYDSTYLGIIMVLLITLTTLVSGCILFHYIEKYSFPIREFKAIFDCEVDKLYICEQVDKDKQA